MLKTSVAAVLLIGTAGLAGPAFAQGVAPNGGGIGGAIGGRDVLGTTPADNKILVPPGEYVVSREVTLAPGEIIVSRDVRPSGEVVEVHRITESDGRIIETTRTYAPGAVALSYGGMTHGRNVSGGVGGAIGGRNINGTTPPDNATLPWWLRS